MDRIFSYKKRNLYYRPYLISSSVPSSSDSAMLASFFLVAISASLAYGEMFNVTVGADGQLQYNPPFVKAAAGDVVSFTL